MSPNSPMTPSEMISRLAEISIYDGSQYGRLKLLFQCEATHQTSTLEYKGHAALSDAFKCFFLETVERINVESRPKITTPLSDAYALFVPRLVHAFGSLCGAERAAVSGYPLQGYTLLRNIFDDQVLTSAALQKITNFYHIEGVDPANAGKPFDPREAKKLRLSTERNTREQMTGSKSGLSQKAQDELAMWDALFDYETHGARLSLSHRATDWMKGQAPLPILPQFAERSFALFINRYDEVAWMTHRLIPNAQPPGAVLSDAWKEKWRVIDDAFERVVASLSSQLGKGIGDAMVELVKAKFSFDANSHFPL